MSRHPIINSGIVGALGTGGAIGNRARSLDQNQQQFDTIRNDRLAMEEQERAYYASELGITPDDPIYSAPLPALRQEFEHKQGERQFQSDIAAVVGARKKMLATRAIDRDLGLLTEAQNVGVPWWMSPELAAPFARLSRMGLPVEDMFEKAPEQLTPEVIEGLGRGDPEMAARYYNRTGSLPPSHMWDQQAPGAPQSIAPDVFAGMMDPDLETRSQSIAQYHAGTGDAPPSHLVYREQAGHGAPDEQEIEGWQPILAQMPPGVGRDLLERQIMAGETITDQDIARALGTADQKQIRETRIAIAKSRLEEAKDQLAQLRKVAQDDGSLEWERVFGSESNQAQLIEQAEQEVARLNEEHREAMASGTQATDTDAPGTDAATVEVPGAGTVDRQALNNAISQARQQLAAELGRPLSPTDKAALDERVRAILTGGDS